MPTYKYELIKIDTVEYEISGNLPKNINGKDLSFEITASNKTSEKHEHQDLINCEIEIILTEKETGDLYLRLLVSNLYRIQGLRNIITKNVNGEDIMPSIIFDTLSNASVSTVRGILYEKALNTNLSKVFLPLVELEDFNIDENWSQ